MNMERRQFLKYSGLATAGFAFAACSQGGSSNSHRSTAKKPALLFGNLEKTNLNIGIIAVTDSAPLVIAKEKGFFEKYGLNVTLSKEESWDTVQDGLIKGRLDASHALFGMPMFAALGSTKAPMVSLMTLNLNGNAITLSKKAWEAGIRPSTDYLNVGEFTESYKKYIQGFSVPPSFGIEFLSSMHNYNTRYWLSSMGINPEKNVKLIVIPPTQMGDNFKSEAIDGCCVSEPWNEKAVFDRLGFTAFVDRDIWSGHPEKVLATMQPWLDQNPKTARALIAAVLEACRFCDKPKNRLQVVKIISDYQYVNSHVDYTKASMLGVYNYGGFDEKKRIKKIFDFHIFHYVTTNYLKRPNHANYPWRSHGVWLLTQMIRWHQIEPQEYPKDADDIINRIYPVAIYEEVAKALNIPLPGDRMKLEPADVFIDKQAFDPSKPVEYLNSFEIRAAMPQIFALS
jgi:nitrate/nitrite transport system substrate-binding protein